MSLLICIDGGGTYTRCMILDDKESVYEASVKKGSNYKKNENAFEVLERCMGEMLNFLDVYKANEDKEPIIIAGIAGIDTEEEYHLYETFFSRYGKRLMLFNDGVLALKCIFGNKDGMIAIAGTGSNVISQVNHEIIQNHHLGLDTEAGSRYILRNYLKRYLLESDSTVAFVGFDAAEVEKLRVLALNFDKIDFERHHVDSDLAKEISRAAALDNVLAGFAIEEALSDLCVAIKKHLVFLKVTSMEISLHGGLFSSDYVVELFRLITSKELENYHVDLKRYKGNILKNAWRLLEL